MSPATTSKDTLSTAVNYPEMLGINLLCRFNSPVPGEIRSSLLGPFAGDPAPRRLRRPPRELQPRLERLQERLRRPRQGVLAGQREHLHADQQRRVHPAGRAGGLRREQKVEASRWSDGGCHISRSKCINVQGEPASSSLSLSTLDLIGSEEVEKIVRSDYADAKA
jgi:hypothetical protein